jgi:hypothetical protein
MQKCAAKLGLEEWLGSLPVHSKAFQPSQDVSIGE